jgi:hypothetical protein
MKAAEGKCNQMKVEKNKKLLPKMNTNAAWTMTALLRYQALASEKKCVRRLQNRQGVLR